MPIASSGTIKFSDIKNQFGGAGTLKLSDYYASGSRVDKTTINNAVPTSSTVKFTNYYNTGNPVITVLSPNNFFETTTTVDTVATERTANTRLIIAVSWGSGLNDTGSTTCTITGKTVTEHYDVSNSFDTDQQVTTQYSCDVGDVASFECQVNRSYTKTKRAANMRILQVDNAGSFTSPTSKFSRNNSTGTSAETMSTGSAGNKGLTVYTARWSLDSNQQWFGLNADGSTDGTVNLFTGSTFAAYHETNGGNVTYDNKDGNTTYAAIGAVNYAI